MNPLSSGCGGCGKRKATAAAGARGKGPSRSSPGRRRFWGSGAGGSPRCRAGSLVAETGLAPLGPPWISCGSSPGTESVGQGDGERCLEPSPVLQSCSCFLLWRRAARWLLGDREPSLLSGRCPLLACPLRGGRSRKWPGGRVHRSPAERLRVRAGGLSPSGSEAFRPAAQTVTALERTLSIAGQQGRSRGGCGGHQQRCGFRVVDAGAPRGVPRELRATRPSFPLFSSPLGGRGLWCLRLALRAITDPQP